MPNLSFFRFDRRAILTAGDKALMLATIKIRIFVRGKNSAGQQMARAKNAAGPLFRYRTGKLYRSISLFVATPGLLTMNVGRSRTIVRALERRYGIMFSFGDSDKAFNNRVVDTRLKKQGFAPARRVSASLHNGFTSIWQTNSTNEN